MSEKLTNQQLTVRLLKLAHRYDMSHAERYEVDSDAFYGETGFMAPGKDVPMAMMCGQDDKVRRASHELWIATRNSQQRSDILAAAAALCRACGTCAHYDANSAAREGVGYCTHPNGWHRAKALPPHEMCSKWVFREDA